MQRKEKRIVSNAARAWVAIDNLWPPFANHMVLEGKGSIDFNALKQSVEVASEANPGTRLVLRGILGASRWVDSGETPSVRELDGSAWSGYDPDGAPYLRDRLDARKGPTCQVTLVHGDPLRLSIKTYHGVTDGMGTVTWMEDVFRVLRGEKPLGSDFIAIEEDLLNITSKKTEVPLPRQYITPLGSPTPDVRGLTWRRKHINGTVSMLVAKLMVIMAKEAWRNQKGHVRFCIPVDLRPRRENFRSTSNLTNALYIDVTRDHTPEILAKTIREKLDLRDDGVPTWEDRIVRYLPLKIIEKALLSHALGSLASGHFRYTAVVSNMGRFDMDTYSTDEFHAENIFWIPPAVELLPVFLVAAGGRSGIDITVGCPRALADNNRIDNLLDTICQDLSG